MSLRAPVLIFTFCLVFPSVAWASSARGIAAGVDHACVVTSTGGVKCWGGNGFGQLGDGTNTARSSPVDVVGLSGPAIAVGVGRNFSCALMGDHSVQCWGYNAYGQLGDNTTANRSTAADVTAIYNSAVALAVGRSHACSLMLNNTVQCWGYNAYGQLGDTTVTSRSTPVIANGIAGLVSGVSAGGYHTCVAMADGTAKCWGGNDYGQLGDGTNTERHTAVSVTGLAGSVVTVTAGTYFTCALEAGGGVECWGRNEFGQLGDGSTTDRLTPTGASGLGSGVAAIVGGFTHACAVSTTGALKCWGDNADGQLGDNTNTSPRTTAVAVNHLESGVAAVAVGDRHTCALASSGAVKCWGGNAYGQVGDGTTGDRWTPTPVLDLTGGGTVFAPGAQAVESGPNHVCVVTNAGGVQCWGENGDGQLGDGTTTDRTTPVMVCGLTAGVVAVSAGTLHTCAVTSGGGVKCWGGNTNGQLGDSSTSARLTPVDVSGLTSGVQAVAAGAQHTCALTTAGGVKCWGYNYSGQLGDGSTSSRTSPVDVTGLTGGVAAVATGSSHTCAVTTAGGLKCWGNNGSYQLGDGSTNNRSTAVTVSGLTSGVTAVSAGSQHTCAVTAGGAVKCWGDNASGQIGDGTTAIRATPTAVSGLTGGALAVSLGSVHSCARTDEGRILCWGYNSYGNLGDGTTTNRSTPVTAGGLTRGTTSVSAGMYMTCAVTSRSGVQCWGINSIGQLGDGTTTNRSRPGWVTGFVAGVHGVGGGLSFNCRLTKTGGVQCWGQNDWGQDGDGTTTRRLVPVDVVGLSSDVVAVEPGSTYACALTSAGGVKCWGGNGAGQLGDGTTSSRTTPVDVVGLTSGVVAISAGDSSACAVTAAGSVECWGNNDFGKLGDGTTTNRLTPVHVVGLSSGVSAVEVGAFHACALLAGGGVQCWGYNHYGELGDGTWTDRGVPRWVSGAKAHVTALSVGGHHSCALGTGGGLRCWGYNNHGQLGDGTTTMKSTAVDVSGLTSGVVAAGAGDYFHCALKADGSLVCWGQNGNGQLGNNTLTDQATPVSVGGFSNGEPATVGGGRYNACALMADGGAKCWGEGGQGALGQGTTSDRLTAVYVRGFKQDDSYDIDTKADLSVYRASAGTWFSLSSASGNTTFSARGWGVQAQGDTPAPGDYDGDGIVDPTVFRPSTGTWFILQSSSGYTTWDYFGWGSNGDIPVPADYDGDGRTDGAVFRPATGVWYVRPSAGGTQWNVTFGNATDVPMPGQYDSDGKADIAVYRPSTGTWFILTSSSGFADYWYRGWGVNAQGDTPAPGDYDGDGRMDLCVFRPSTGSWYILESQHDFATWRYLGWGSSGDLVVPADYDGDGITDAAVYRPSNFTWYIWPSSGATQRSTVFGAAGDVPLITIR